VIAGHVGRRRKVSRIKRRASGWTPLLLTAEQKNPPGQTQRRSCPCGMQRFTQIFARLIRRRDKPRAQAYLFYRGFDNLVPKAFDSFSSTRAGKSTMCIGSTKVSSRHLTAETTRSTLRESRSQTPMGNCKTAGLEPSRSSIWRGEGKIRGDPVHLVDKADTGTPYFSAWPPYGLRLRFHKFATESNTANGDGREHAGYARTR